MMKVVILSGAEADLDEIYDRLEETSGGERFLLALDRELELLRTFPRMSPPAPHGKVRRLRIGRTSFGLFYTIEGSRLMVIAVLDLRQEPQALAKIIRGRL